MENEKCRRHYYFSGSVQGVGFRYRAYHAACSLGLTGWVKNLWDGRVEMEVQGKPADIDKMIQMIQRGTYIWLEDVACADRPLEEESGFHVR